MKLSVIVVSWNAKDYLAGCLRSLFPELEGIDSEVIVVDNCSSDGSPEAVETLFPQAKLIRNAQNLGFAKANNIGIRLSSGEYVCLMNSDIVVGKGCIRKMLAYMDSNPHIGVLGPKTLNGDGSLQRSCFNLPTAWNTFCSALALDTMFPNTPLFRSRAMSYWAHDEVRNVEALNGCFLVVRRAALNDVGLLDEEFFFYGEDLDWCKRFGDGGWGVVFYPYAEAVHFGGASSANAPVRYYVEMNKADLKYWRKHKGPGGELLYSLILLLRNALRVIGYAPLCIVKKPSSGARFHKVNRSVQCLRWLLTRRFTAGAEHR